jgi:triosephosphate isomerase
MARKLIIAANWKMNKGPAETADFISAFLPSAQALAGECDIVIAPPFVSIPSASILLADSPVALSAQNASEQEKGAFTGEVSTAMLKETGVQHVILGHSERRSIYGEGDQLINAKVKKCLAEGLHPIFCIGETLEERESGKLQEVLRRQVSGGLAGLSNDDMSTVVLAYEPVWAIGTGVTATPEQAQEAHAFVRTLVGEQFGKEVAEATRIQYGGSVKPSNSADLMAREDIDGVLVGGASLEAESFRDLIANAVA